MKTVPAFKTSWFLLAIIVAIVGCETIAWELETRFGIRNNPLVVGVLAVGLVATIVSVIYDGVDIG